MWRKIKSWFAWRLVLDTGTKAYWHNLVTFERKIITYRGKHVNLHPTEHEWLCEVPKRPAPRPAVGGSKRGEVGRLYEMKSAGTLDDWLLQREMRKAYTFPEALPDDMLRAWREGVGKSTHDAWKESPPDFDGKGLA